ncbi:hypothetical protein EKO23_01070 [Nocardioides guangzhouensis]|uniref:Uncharacterized protein n=1 Tax=Nocardioides guangzhouensis TaxID=2497878 RepID=A0A4Q4ZLW0_9ACTN|nr:hypothetical protein [Nocardioides guangzhouensis]RYP89048.1 hypothetical protein EKO23_01070 [Nocardioides guangzhouensis]
MTGEILVIHDLTVTHGEAASFVRSQLTDHGPEAAADLVRRALPVGLVALSMGTAGIDTGSLTRTLDTFADRVDAKSEAALASLDQTLTRLKAGEETVARTASLVLENLPAQVEAALSGQAGNVRATVVEAARAVQAAGMQELTTALARHSDSVRDALSLDREGPVRMLRQDLLEELNGTRRELGEQLALVRSLVEAAQVAKTAGAKSSRAIGAANEDEAMALCQEVVTAAGDMFEPTGGQPGVGTTRRTGDGVATLSPSITGHGRRVRIVLEAKLRSRSLSAKAYRDEVATGCRVRDAAGGLVLVPTRAEVPGGGVFARVDSCAYVVAAEDPETVSLIYLLLREQVAMLTVRQDDDAEIDLAQIEARLSIALAGIAELDEVGRLAVQAQKALEKLIAVGRQTQQKVRDTLTEGITLLHP